MQLSNPVITFGTLEHNYKSLEVIHFEKKTN